VAVDRGDYAVAIEYCDTHPPETDDLFDTLLRAEVDLYLDQLESAHARIEATSYLEEWIDNDSSRGDLAQRWHLVAMDHAYLSGSREAAETLALVLLEVAKRTDRRELQLRALYTLARAARERGDSALASSRLHAALQLAKDESNSCYQGRISYVFGLIAYSEDRTDEALGLIERSVELLSKVSADRYAATAQSLLAVLLCDRGHLDESLALALRAEEMFARIGVMSDLLRARQTKARTLIAAGEYRKAEGELQELLSWQRGPHWNHGLELFILRILSIARYKLRDFKGALSAAREAIALARLHGTQKDVLEGELLEARALARTGEPDAILRLERLQSRADAAPGTYLAAEVRLYLAEALGSADSTRAFELVHEVAAMRVTKQIYWLQREVADIQHDLHALPVWINEEGDLVMSPRRGFPDLKAARAAMERFWLERAIEQAGNVLRAADLLGLSRNEAYTIAAYAIKGHPPRKSRSRAGDNTNGGSRRRSRSS